MKGYQYGRRFVQYNRVPIRNVYSWQAGPSNLVTEKNDL
jgi:hypothetical protein